MATGVAFWRARRARIVRGRSTATWFCTYAHRGPIVEQRRYQTGYRLPATRSGYSPPHPPPQGHHHKKKKEKISRETSASPEDHQATARPHSTREAAWPPVTPSHTSSPVTKPQQISPGSLTGLGLGTRTGEGSPEVPRPKAVLSLLSVA